DSRLRWSPADLFLPAKENVNRVGGMCRGVWLKYLCHDDLLRPNCLETIAAGIRAYEGANVGLVTNYEETLFSNGYVAPPPRPTSPTPRFYRGHDFLRRSLAGRSPDVFPALTTATVRREAWEAMSRFDTNYDAHFDTFLWHRVLTKYDMVVVPEPLTVNRIH